MPNDEKPERKSYTDGSGGRYDVSIYAKRAEVYHCSADGRSSSVGQLHGGWARERALILIRALVRDARRKARRARRASLVDPTTGGTPRQGATRRPRPA